MIRVNTGKYASRENSFGKLCAKIHILILFNRLKMWSIIFGSS